MDQCSPRCINTSKQYSIHTSQVAVDSIRPHRSTIRTYVRSTAMRPIVTDRVASSVDRSAGLSVGLSVTLVSPAKTAEPIEMPFGLRNGWAQGIMY